VNAALAPASQPLLPWPERSASGGPTASTGVRSAVAAAGIGFFLSATAISGTNAVPVIARISYPQVAHWRDTASRAAFNANALTVIREQADTWDLDMPASVSWLHDASGLTWDQLGRALGVSRRAVHMWATGGRINSTNAEHLNELVGVVRQVQSEHPSDVRAALLAPRAGGRSIFDDFRARTQSTSGNISGTPFAPDQLVGARHDPVEGDS
jgi:hypothetical protein